MLPPFAGARAALQCARHRRSNPSSNPLCTLVTSTSASSIQMFCCIQASVVRYLVQIAPAAGRLADRARYVARSGPLSRNWLDLVGCNTANQVSGFLPNGQICQYEPLRGISQLARMLAAPLHSDATLVPAHLRTGRPLEGFPGF